MISFAITVCNEKEEVVELLSQVQDAAHSTDEIVVQWDEDGGSEEVWNMLYNYQESLKKHENELPIRLIKFPLNGDFASFKNNLKANCTKDWVFQIDADEGLAEGLLLNLHEIVESNAKFDAMALPRVNTVEGITLEDVSKWRWTLTPSLSDEDQECVDEFKENDPALKLLQKYNLVADVVNTTEGVQVVTYCRPAINWPDYQCRLIRNVPEIKWERKVHEIIVGHKNMGFAPQQAEWALMHNKTIDRQRKQNNFYEKL